MSNKELLRKAFDQVCNAMVELETAKSQLATLHYKAEKVEDTAFVLERVSKTLAPDSDSHEAVFIQHQMAKDDLKDALYSKGRHSIERHLETAYNATSEAFSVIHRV